MSVVTIKSAAVMVGLTQQTLYRAIKSGKLSKTYDNKGIDTSELVRVYGTIDGVAKEILTVKTNIKNPSNTQLEDKIKVLEKMINGLETDKEQAIQREQRLLTIIESKLLVDGNTKSTIQPISKIFSKLFS